MKKNKSIIQYAVTTVFLGLLIYAAYSLWYIYYGKDSSWDVHLYTVLSGSALGWFLAMFVQSVFKKSNWIAGLIAFLAGNGFFQGLIWGFNEKLNYTGNDRELVVIRTFTVVFALSAVLLLAAFIIRAKSKHKALNIILAVVYFAVSCGGVYVFNRDNLNALEYKKNIRFDSITADEMNVTDSEKALCADWLAENLSYDSKSLPFTFSIDGENSIPTNGKSTQRKHPYPVRFTEAVRRNTVYGQMRKKGLK